MFEKIHVNGDTAHPIYRYLKNEAKGIAGKKIKWNFTKFLIDPKGKVLKRYSPTVLPLDLREDIESLINDN